MQAYHNDKKIKKQYLDRVKAHKKADEIIKGKYWYNGKGCAVGCTVHSIDHSAYEIELGIPRAVARLEDVIFEGLPNDMAKKWPERFLEAVPVGADLSMVWPKFTVWTLRGVLQYAKPKSKTAITDVIILFDEWIAGNKPSSDRFWEARKAAAYAADAAAYAAYAAAAYAADAAAYAADAAAYAAYAAAAYAADAYARNKFWLAASDELIRLIKECK